MATPRRPSPGIPVRSEILRRYHEVQYGRSSPHPSAFEGATFEEYLRLLRLSYPGISDLEAARLSKNPGFQALAEKLAAEAPPEPGKPAPMARRVVLDRKESLDLVTDGPAADVEWLQLDRIKSLSGWRRLRDLPDLRHLTVIFCGTEEEYDGGPTVSVKNLDLTECSRACTRLLLQLARPESFSIQYPEDPVFDLGWLKDQTSLRLLYITDGLARGAKALAKLPLEDLGLARIAMDEEFLGALASLRTLRRLRLRNQEAFPPGMLPDLPYLEKLTLPAHAELRQAWIDYAVAHPEVDCAFPPPGEIDDRKPKARMVGIHRGTEIFEFSKGRKTWYQAWGDFASRIPDSQGKNNHDIRERLAPTAARLKPKVELSSEADELVISSSSRANVEACIDAVFGKSG